MIISVTGISKGQGQTVTAINLCGRLSLMFKEKKILVIDINKYCTDVKYYLSQSDMIKNLDDIKIRLDRENLDKENFITLTNKVKDNIYMLGSNESFDLTEKEIKQILELASYSFEFIVIDTIAGENNFSDLWLNNSDAILIVTKQIKKHIKRIVETESFIKYLKKSLYIINEYNERIKYQKNQIKRDLNIDSGRLMILDYDESIINNCNDDAVLNYSINKKTIYNNQMDLIIERIAQITGYDIESNRTNKKEKKKGLFGKFFT